MEKKEALKILHDMQKWRRYRGKLKTQKMPHSAFNYGKAIDFAIRYLRNN